MRFSEWRVVLECRLRFTGLKTIKQVFISAAIFRPTIMIIIIVGLNAQGDEIRDPSCSIRESRAETAGPSGKLTYSELLYGNDGDFLVTIPDDAIALKI